MDFYSFLWKRDSLIEQAMIADKGHHNSFVLGYSLNLFICLAMSIFFISIIVRSYLPLLCGFYISILIYLHLWLYFSPFFSPLWSFSMMCKACEFIIMSCRPHGYPWPSLATFPYRSSPPAGLLGYILCPHIAAVCKFGLVVLLLLGHMWGSIVVRHLRARFCFSSSVRRIWLVWPV